MNRLLDGVANWAAGKAQQKVQDYVALMSQEFGILLNEHMAVLDKIPELLQNNQRKQVQEALDSLATRLSHQEVVDLTTLITDAEEHPGNIGALEEFIRAKKGHMGTVALVKKVAQTFIAAATEQARTHLGTWYENFKAKPVEDDAFIDEVPEIAVEDHILTEEQQEALQELPEESGNFLDKLQEFDKAAKPQAVEEEEEPVRPTEQQIEAKISAKSHLLAENATQMVLGKTVLGWACGIQNLSHNTIVHFIECAHDRNIDFQVMIFNEIDDANDVNSLRKFFAKACYVILNPIVGFYVKHVSENFLTYCRSFLAEFNKEGDNHFTPALNRSIEFLNDHLQTVGGAYERAANHPNRDAAINGLMREDLRRRECNRGMSEQELFARVAEESIERFTPISNLRTRIADTLASVRIPEESMWAWLNYPLGAVIGVTTLILTPFLFVIEWSGNTLAKMVLKKLAIHLNLVPSLFASTSQAVGIGESYKHVLNTFLVQQLEMAWKLMNANSKENNSEIDLATFERSLPGTTRANLKNLISSLFLDVGYTCHSDNPAALQAYIAAQKASLMPDSIKAFLGAFGVPLDIHEQAKETTVKYLALLLNTIVKKDMLNELTLTSLTTFNESCFTSKGHHPTKEQMAATEEHRNKLLNNIIHMAIRQAVNDQFYPMKRIQKEATQFVRQLHIEIQEFMTNMDQLHKEDRFSDMLISSKQFILARVKALSSQKGSPNVNNHSYNNFNQISKAFRGKLKPIRKTLLTLSRCEQMRSRATTESKALQSLGEIFEKFESEDHSTTEVRAATLEAIQDFEKTTASDLTKSKDLRSLKVQPLFTNVSHALSDWDSAQEFVSVAERLTPILAGQNAVRVLAEEIETYHFVSPLAETIKQTLLLELGNGNLNVEYLNTMIRTNQETIAQCGTTLQEGRDFMTILAPLSEKRERSMQQAEAAIKAETEKLEDHFKALTDWASTKKVIEEQIVALNTPPTDQQQAPEWGTEILQPFQCQNTFPIDLTAFADTVREFVIRQISSYVNTIPLFCEQDYNVETFMRRMMTAFVHDQRIPPPVVG